jgi:hypothetical protein
LTARGPNVGVIRLPEEPRGRPVAGDAKPPAAAPGAQPGAGMQAPGRAPASDMPAGADVPAGADPQAWLGLTPEEREYFARLASEGRLSYGPVDRAGEAALYRGRHLSIRV